MRVFLAGASGTIGLPLVRALVAAGHDVTAMTRSPEKQEQLRTLGSTPVVADALDADGLMRAVAAARPDVVMHQLTNLPKTGVRSAQDVVPTNRLRTDGTRHLIAAAVAARARRIVAASFALVLAAPADSADEAASAVRSLESQIVEANRSGAIEGLVLRYGLWYGPGNPATQQMMTMLRRRLLPVVRGDQSLLPLLHLDDAVTAAVAALDHGRPGAIYDVVEDRPASATELVRELARSIGAPQPLVVPPWVPRLFAPYLARITSVRLPLTNEMARAELGWSPAHSLFQL